MNELFCALVAFAQQSPLGALLVFLLALVVLALVITAVIEGGSASSAGHRSAGHYTSRIDHAGTTARQRMRDASHSYVRSVHDTLRR